ncbi:MAG: glycosyltransferase family 1 protein [Aquificae bacterium]|nr:glycosyltransferase family 1 protein [Aquificota bacterium]
MEKIKVALLLSGFENFADVHLLKSIEEYLPDERFELKVFKIDVQNVAKTVKEVEDYRPLFTVDFNTKGVIWGERENEKRALQDLLGTLHFTIFTEDPHFHAENVWNLRNSPNTVFLITDLRYGQFLGALGFPNIYYFTPCVNLRLVPPSAEKEVDVVFVGDAIDPAFIVETWNRFMDPPIRDFAVEVGEFCFRNPEVSPPFATDYLLPLMNPQFQESFNKFRQENPTKYFTWLAQISVYATARRNWFILGFLEGTELTVVGKAEGNLPDSFKVADITSFEERIGTIAKAKLGLMTFPAYVPSGIGFTPLEVAACETAPMINFRSTLPSFFKPNEEVIVYNALDRLDIEEKLLFYLENEEDRKLIAQNAAKAVKERFSCKDRVEFFKELMKGAYEQIVQQKQAEETSGDGDAPVS